MDAPMPKGTAGCGQRDAIKAWLGRKASGEAAGYYPFSAPELAPALTEGGKAPAKAAS